jgi:hypothetical protein
MQCLHCVQARTDSWAPLALLLERFLPRLRRWTSGRLPGGVRDLADTSNLVQDVLLQPF